MHEVVSNATELTKNLVILVDDDTAGLAEADTMLEEAGYLVRMARSERGAQDLAYLEPPSCLIVSYSVVRTTDMAMLRKFKNDNVYGHLPVILLLTAADLEKGLDWASVPADDYLLKPFTKTELVSRVALARARSQRDVGANPLTGLPGNLAILREAERRLAKEQSFAMAYLDIDHFKVFNDTYGFSRGDEVLRMTARVIVNGVLSADDKECTVGHIGGDDFVFITPSNAASAACERIIADFDRIIPAFYDEKDRARGLLEAMDRQGVIRQFPLASLSIAVVDTSLVDIHHVGDLSSRAAQVKKYVKQMPGSAYMIDRRK